VTDKSKKSIAINTYNLDIEEVLKALTKILQRIKENIATDESMSADDVDGGTRSPT
jgi:hypothetical protein